MNITELKTLDEVNSLYEKDELYGMFKMPNDVYRAAPGINQSFLKNYMKSPRYAKYWKDKGNISSDAQIIGDMFDLLMTDKESFGENYLVVDDEMIMKPGGGIYTKNSIRWRDIVNANKGQICITTLEYANIRRIVDSAKNTDSYKQRFSDCETQVVIFSDIKDVFCKGKLDFIKPGLIADLKSTKSANPYSFRYDIKKYGYDIQMAFYLSLARSYIEIDECLFYVVEKTEPYFDATYTITEDDINNALIKIYDQLPKIKFSLESDYWPGYADNLVVIDLSGNEIQGDF